MDQPDRIHLRDHLVEVEIGAFQSERGVVQRLRFSLIVDLVRPDRGHGDDDDPPTGSDDQVDRILSYDVLTRAIDNAMAERRYDLLETLAERIAAEVLANPRAARIEVTIEKLDRVPGALGITIARRRGEVPTRTAPAAPVVVLRLSDRPLPPDAEIVVPDTPGLPLPEGGNARRIALLALDQAAWALAARLEVTVADSLTELEWAATAHHPVVWAPARMAADLPGVPAQPVALALWLARRMGARRLDVIQSESAPAPDLPADPGVPVRILSG
ncbi:dihydroneopterin aldolase [uncultured Paracoccus sp.]|uniref:dihydroneopterin aldolase n=1 Tax=uncultured Paracoccus sp. TaxID=189685 RepID=UPI002602DA52|nr:dihydroneopterin aldolase [uncultured Paracoccus sp.]